MAAGMGGRYGALKQMDRIGRGGEVLLHYSVYDAARSGFEKAVFVIRHAIEKDFYEVVLKRLPPSIKYSVVYQELDTNIPPEIYAASQALGRTQPWGTTHAILCAADQLDAPFLAINADDFYGLNAFKAMSQFLTSPQGAEEGAIVTYVLAKTLSATGAVTRAVCKINDGLLKGVEELHAIEKKGTIIFNTDSEGKKKQLMPDTPVSMNFWGFPPSALPHFQKFFSEYLLQLVKTRRHECYIPLVVDWLIRQGAITVRSLKTVSEWFGITWQADRQDAIMRILDLNRAGVYPSPLWE
jgi:NDP-sugar pyrophosphorylase family protein